MLAGGPPVKTSDPVLALFRAAVAELYGERIERVVLYGSRARGDARPDSDYDVAVFLKGLTSSRWGEVRRIADIAEAIRTAEHFLAVIKTILVLRPRIKRHKPAENGRPARVQVSRTPETPGLPRTLTAGVREAPMQEIA